VKQPAAPPFHGKLDGETAAVGSFAPVGETGPPDDFSAGFLIGLLVGEGHFGGDGRQPQVTLRMHVRHEKLFRWLQRMFPGGRLYGPYHHGGRYYYQWMARGEFLRRVLVPLVSDHLPGLDDYAAERFRSMCERYQVERPAEVPRVAAKATAPGRRKG
jgi:hypothetical protein